MSKKYIARTINNIEPDEKGNIELNLDEGVTEEFIVTKGGGNFVPGNVFPGGKTIAEAFKLLLTSIYYPNITSNTPSYSITNDAGLREVGDKFNLTLTSTFNRGSIVGDLVNNLWITGAVQNPLAGLPTQHIINGTTYPTTSVTQNRVINDVVTLLGTNGPYTGRVDYSVGPQAYDSDNPRKPFGVPYPQNNLTNSTSFVGYLRRFMGTMPTRPVNGKMIRDAFIGTSVLNTGNTFSFQTGSTNRVFIVAVPNGKILVSAITQYLEVLQLTLATDLTTIPDASGTTQRPYKIYILETVDPFPSDTTINVTLTNG